jgi:hypothetical protein
MEVDTVPPKRTLGDRPEQFQSSLEPPPAKSSYNKSQDKDKQLQGNDPYG